MPQTGDGAKSSARGIRAGWGSRNAFADAVTRTSTFFVRRVKAWMAGTSPAMTMPRQSALKRNEIWMNRHRALACCLRMIFLENRFALFRIML